MPTPAATPLAQCPAGEEHDLYTAICIPHLVPNAGSPYQAIGGNPDLAAVTIPGGGGSIPCTGHNSGQCIGLAEEAAAEGPAAVPRSTVGSSPTVTGSEGSSRRSRGRPSLVSSWLAYMVVSCLQNLIPPSSATSSR